MYQTTESIHDVTSGIGFGLAHLHRTIYEERQSESRPHQEAIERIVMDYRAAKAAEKGRSQLLQTVTAQIRNAWGFDPTASKEERDRRSQAAKNFVKFALRESRPKDKNGKKGIVPFSDVLSVSCTWDDLPADLPSNAEVYVDEISIAWWNLEIRNQVLRKELKRLLATLPISKSPLLKVKGLSEWGIIVLIAECGPELDGYLKYNTRKVYKRLGFAPNDTYERGEKRDGRKIPRSKKGAVYGQLLDPLIKHQWAREKDGVPAHAVGPFGERYGDAKAKAISQGKHKAHAEKLAKRVMLKAVIHDFCNAWWGRPLDYV